MQYQNVVEVTVEYHMLHCCIITCYNDNYAFKVMCDATAT